MNEWLFNNKWKARNKQTIQWEKRRNISNKTKKGKRSYFLYDNHDITPTPKNTHNDDRIQQELQEKINAWISNGISIKSAVSRCCASLHGTTV